VSCRNARQSVLAPSCAASSYRNRNLLVPQPQSERRDADHGEYADTGRKNELVVVISRVVVKWRAGQQRPRHLVRPEGGEHSQAEPRTDDEVENQVHDPREVPAQVRGLARWNRFAVAESKSTTAGNQGAQ